MRPDENAFGVALVLGDIGLNPLDQFADVAAAVIPGQALAAAALHVDSHHSVFHGPQHDVVVEGVAVGDLLDLIARASGDVDQDRARAAFVGREDVDDIAGVGAEGDVARDFDAGIGLMGLKRAVEFGGGRGVHDGSDFLELRGDVGRHLSVSECSHREGRGDAESGFEHGASLKGLSLAQQLIHGLNRC